MYCSIQIIVCEWASVCREKSFVKWTQLALEKLGFHNYNTLPCVSVCRDEMCTPLIDLVDHRWRGSFPLISGDVNSERNMLSHPFVFSSLGGMILLGKTGMGAALSHGIKHIDGRQRFVFFAMAHIGMNKEGVLGEVERPGLQTTSHACGALVKFFNEMKKGYFNFQIDPQDVEYSFLKQKLISKFKLFSEEGKSNIPSLKELTDIMHKVILEDIESLILHTVDTEKTDYAVLAGVEIHTPDGRNHIWPGETYAVVSGEKKSLDFRTYMTLSSSNVIEKEKIEDNSW